MPGLDDIAVFVKVIQEGSFTRAAKALAMPNATVSAKVAALERRLGVTLIRRTTRKLHVTETGEAYFRKCVEALGEILAAEREVATTQAEPSGALRITSLTDVGLTLLPVMVKEFLRRYPKMEVDLLITNRVVDLVAEGVDLGIRAGELEDSSMIGRRFVSMNMTLWAQPAYLKKHGTPSHPRDLENHAFIRFSPIEDRRIALVKDGAKFRLPTKGRISVDDLVSLKMFVLNGDGLGLLPSFLCEEDAASGKLAPVLRGWELEGGSLMLVYPAQRFVAPKITAFLEIAEELSRKCGDTVNRAGRVR